MLDGSAWWALKQTTSHELELERRKATFSEACIALEDWIVHLQMASYTVGRVKADMRLRNRDASSDLQ
eukprot:8885385-Karenia_brevis.AAC.1